jgi:hypothetical protein
MGLPAINKRLYFCESLITALVYSLLGDYNACARTLDALYTAASDPGAFQAFTTTLTSLALPVSGTERALKHCFARAIALLTFAGTIAGGTS